MTETDHATRMLTESWEIVDYTKENEDEGNAIGITVTPYPVPNTLPAQDRFPENGKCQTRQSTLAVPTGEILLQSRLHPLSIPSRKTLKFAKERAL